MDKDTNIENRRAFIDTIIIRVQSLLPNRTGHPLAEVELNPQFLIAKKILIDNHNKHPSIITFILVSLCHHLIAINDEANGIKLKDRDEKSLSSTLIIVKLLSDILKYNWNRQKTIYNYDINDVVSNYSRYYYYERPNPIDSSVINHLLSTFMNLLSSGVLKRVLSVVKPELDYENNPIIDSNSSGTTTTNSSLQQQLNSSSSQEMEILNNYINEIDNNIEIILRYIASANPDNYYDFIQSKLFTYSNNDELIPIPILQKYSPMIKFMFFSHANSEKIAADIIKALPLMKSISWKQVFYVFLATSVKDQTFSRTQDYNSIITFDNPEFLKVDQNLFDHASSVFDDNFTALPCSTFTLTWLVILCIEDYVELDSGKPLNKLKISFNKRLKFLVTILKDSSLLTNLESFDSLINMFHLAARLKSANYIDHPIYKFGLKYLDTTHINLSKYGQHHATTLANDESLFIKYDYLVVNFYIAACMLKPEKYNNIVIQNYMNYKDNIREVKILVKILKGFSELDRARNIFKDLMIKLSTALKSMIFGSIKILRQYDYERQSVLSSSSSAASLYSDILSVESGQLFNFPSEFPLTKKTSLDHYLQDISPSSTSLSNTNNHNLDAQLEESTTNTTTNTTKQHNSVTASPHNTHLLHPHHGSHSSSSTTTTTGHNSLSKHRLKLVNTTQEILSDAFLVFTAAPDLYFNDSELMNDFNLQNGSYDELIHKILLFCQEACIPFKMAFKSKVEDPRLFDAACSLAMKLVDEDTRIAKNYTTLSTFANYTISNYIIQSICESSLSLSLTDSKFKACFLFINDFLQRRDVFGPIILSNKIITDKETGKYFEVGGGVIHSIEKILLLSLCTHDIQFYNIAKITMRWYCNEINTQSQLYKNNGQEIDENLIDTFEKIVSDDSVFTGFVSLHKRFRNILRDAKPTKSLYQVWLVIYNRWLELLEIKDESLVFKHYTGFLVSTSGCFLSTNFSNNDPIQKEKSFNYISDFFDKCIGLLTFPDLGIRLVVTDALSNESHSDVYHLISTKLMTVGNVYAEKKIINDESVLYIEQALVIITNMITIKNDGAFLLVSLLPNICQFFLKFINLLDDVKDMLRLKLKFCRLGITLEGERERVGLKGAFKLRNLYAKASAEWLEQAVFFEDPRDDDGTGTINSSGHSIKSATNESELYLMDLAVLSSKCLSLQLEEIVLEVPEGTKDTEIRKYKDLAFGNYFSIFYKIIQKYSVISIPTTKSRHKINQIIENILKSVSNILKFDTDIGMQFVLPMGYHPNKKIRSIFLSVFSYMLASRKSKKSKDEYPEHIIEKLSEIIDIYGAVAEVASSTEHSLFSSSLFGIFGYTKKLDGLFRILLNEEFNNVTRSSDMFRSNSTLTRLLSNFVKDYGTEYLVTTLKPFVQELIDNDIICQVEKVETTTTDTELFMKYFNQLVDIITESIDNIPDSFKFICSEIYICVEKKFTDSALIAVGSFLFLRFICPAIVSPEVFLDVTITNPKVRKTLIQLTKVLQNIANGSLSSLKLPGLASKVEEINLANIKVFAFMKQVATQPSHGYPFESIPKKPVAELRYLHKFIYTYFVNIKIQYLTSTNNTTPLHERIQTFKLFDEIAHELGYAKPSVQLQINGTRTIDPNNVANNQYNDFMTKMSLEYNEKSIETTAIENSIFSDGTPVVLMHFKQLHRQLNNDLHLMVYKYFETASQVWDNKFYVVLNFTELVLPEGYDSLYINLISTYAPEQLFKNCARIYYYNIPRSGYIGLTNAMRKLRQIGAEFGTKIYTYSQVDPPEIIHSLCLDAETISILRDTKVIFNHVKVYDESTQTYSPINLRIGRRWLQLCSEEEISFKGPACVTDSFVPVEIYRLSEVNKCEISNYTGHADEFTVNLSFGHKITMRSHERSEILRFVYFTTSRLTKEIKSADERSSGGMEIEHNMHWFGRLYNIVFQGLLCNDDEVRLSSSLLFGALSTYFDIDFGIDCHHAKSIAFPANSTQFVVSVSTHLSNNLPTLSYRFFKAFFDNYDKLPEENKLSSIIYISPWIRNIYDYIYLASEENGAGRLAELVRQFCRISALNKDHIAFLNDYIWKRLFSETRLISVLVDEVVAFAVDNKNDTDWSFIIATISPSIEVSGEVVSRLINCVNKAKKHESSIASQSRLFEIKVLVKICSSLFFNSYTLARLYVADIFFFCTLFIDNIYLEFGADLQKLVINIIQSFLHKPELTNQQEIVVDDTITYFSSQRAKMLFGMTRDITSSSMDIGQIYNRATNFEILCDYLNDFIMAIGSTDDTKLWRARWCSNAIDVAFSKDSLFQSRGILVYGILAKSGINDSTACRGLKLIANGDVSTLEYTTSITIATARVIQGLPKTSILPPVLIWPQFCFGLMNYSVLYQPSIQCLVNCLEKIFEVGQDYIDKSFEQRLFLEPYISEFEKSYKFEITQENFGIHIFFVLTQGLRVSHFKHTSITCLKQYFTFRYKYRNRSEAEGIYASNNALAYLLFIFLSTDENEFDGFIKQLGLQTDYVSITNGKLPRIIVEFLTRNNYVSQISLIHAAYFVESKSIDSVFKTKFLQLYDYIFRRVPELGLLVYHIVKPALEQSFLTSNSTDLVETISKIMISVFSSDTYSPAIYKGKVDEVLQAHKVSIVKENRKMRSPEGLHATHAFENTISSDLKKLQMMLYRSACLFVEGSRLED